MESTINPCQYAYQPNISTIDALIQLIDDITAQLDNLNTNFIHSATLDFSKAFDKLQPAKPIVIISPRSLRVIARHYLQTSYIVARSAQRLSA